MKFTPYLIVSFVCASFVCAELPILSSEDRLLVSSFASLGEVDPPGHHPLLGICTFALYFAHAFCIWLFLKMFEYAHVLLLKSSSDATMVARAWDEVALTAVPQIAHCGVCAWHPAHTQYPHLHTTSALNKLVALPVCICIYMLRHLTVLPFQRLCMCIVHLFKLPKGQVCVYLFAYLIIWAMWRQRGSVTNKARQHKRVPLG